MSRYENTKIMKTSNKKKSTRSKKSRYGTVIYNFVPENNSDIFIITQEGDRLDNLAFQFYGDPHLWWFIANVNNLSTMNVEADVQLRIPSSTDGAFGN